MAQPVKIGSYVVGDGHPCFVAAEIGINHNGKVDIAKNSCVAGYISRNYTYLGYISGWGYQYRAPSGNLYTDEGNHWDILYYTCGC